MAKLKDELFDEIAANIIEKGESDDLAKFMLSGREHIEAVQRYFYNLEADKKKELALRGNEWSLGPWFADEIKWYTGLSLFKVIAPSIIPFVEDLRIMNIQLDDYSFLNNIKQLKDFWLNSADNEHIKVLSALSNLESVNFLRLGIKSLNLQLLSSLSFSFNRFTALNFIFETDPKCDKTFQTTRVFLHGNEEAMNDFVFTRENYQKYADIFPNAEEIYFTFFMKVVDDVSDLLKVSSPNYSYEVEVANRNIKISYRFSDYSGHPDSKVLEMIEDSEDWHTYGCPYADADFQNRHVRVICKFPLAIAEVGNRLAEQSLRRIPEGSNGSPEDYHRLIIENEWDHYAEFEVLKNILVEDLCEAYCEITGIYPDCLSFLVDSRLIPKDGTVGDNFQDGDIVFCCV